MLALLKTTSSLCFLLFAQVKMALPRVDKELL